VASRSGDSCFVGGVDPWLAHSGHGKLHLFVGVRVGFGLSEFWKGRRVFITGHTGFKGSWMSKWLGYLGAEVYGFALAPPTDPSLFELLELKGELSGHTEGDIRDLSTLKGAMRAAKPELVIHMAAQALVRASYEDPIETFSVNVMGTVHVLEAARCTESVRGIVNVTTDKCYESKEWVWPYREGDRLGGRDPYSSSKSCSELITAAYRSSFFFGSSVSLATARAGNVIGGGDWAKDRLIPDFIRARGSGSPLIIRSPGAVRPWQHVLDPLAGYQLLARSLLESKQGGEKEWNFGPDASDARSVDWVMTRLDRGESASGWRVSGEPQPHETHSLRLDSSQARELLGWAPRWDIEEALDRTMEWYSKWQAGADMSEVTLSQIRMYMQKGE
jgi:CDP-glucose 4,6-dehydratase